jgi:hypothetical protein
MIELRNLGAALLGLLLTLVTATASAIDLTGIWEGNDGGTYYLRQLGDELYWFGELSPTSPAWSNVFYGRVQFNQVIGEWSDVPKGRANSSGKLLLKIRSKGNELAAEQKTGGFSGSVWTRKDAYFEGRAAVPMPDLRVKQFRFARGSTSLLEVEVANDGRADAGPAVLRLTIRKIGGSTVGRTTQVPLDGVPMGTTSWTTVDAARLLPRGVELRATAFTLNVDSANTVTESDEANNASRYDPR